MRILIFISLIFLSACAILPPNVVNSDQLQGKFSIIVYKSTKMASQGLFTWEETKNNKERSQKLYLMNPWGTKKLSITRKSSFTQSNMRWEFFDEYNKKLELVEIKRLLRTQLFHDDNLNNYYNILEKVYDSLKELKLNQLNSKSINYGQFELIEKINSGKVKIKFKVN